MRLVIENVHRRTHPYLCVRLTAQLRFSTGHKPPALCPCSACSHSTPRLGNARNSENPPRMPEPPNNHGTAVPALFRINNRHIPAFCAERLGCLGNCKRELQILWNSELTINVPFNVTQLKFYLHFVVTLHIFILIYCGSLAILHVYYFLLLIPILHCSVSYCTAVYPDSWCSTLQIQPKNHTAFLATHVTIKLETWLVGHELWRRR